MHRLALVLALCLPTVASADALPSCPPDSHMVMNPSTPGSGHHGGAFCAPDEPPVNPPPGGAEVPLPPNPEPAPVAPVAAPASAPSPGEGAAPPPAAARETSGGLCSASPLTGPAPIGLSLLVLGLVVLRRLRLS